ncbi:MAG: Alg9-like mannosyltransferase family-domain-containing protein [Benjaminiella poitrasii]|nr:MAG: Alg9-like mannosyltransferase family-domain-containing protein [Benjaminiella poitrasii]
MIRYLTFTSVVFRFEIGILLVVLVCAELMHRTIDVKTVVREMVVTGLLNLLATVPLDSYLWQTWLWPEGEVFYFNAILNKSSEWGTLPFHAYFTSFLPRLLLVSYPLAGVAFGTDSRARRLLTPMLAYVALFSCLPHKEWRFIMYTIPVFTAAAASSVSSAITAASRSFFRRVLLLGTLGAILASFGIALAMFQISRLNYPGGHALASLHAIEQNKPYVSVHLDVDTAMTGASLFGHANSHWHYSKNETHKTEADFLDAHYTHLITAHPERFNSSLFKVIDTIYGLDTVQLKSLSQWQDELHRGDLLPVRFNMAPKLYTLRLDKPYQVWIQSTLLKHPFVLYSKTYCPYSMAAKRLLSKYCKDVHVVEANLDRDPDEVKFALFHLTRQATFPNFFKNGQSLGGYDQLMALEREGKLADICNA